MDIKGELARRSAPPASVTGACTLTRITARRTTMNKYRSGMPPMRRCKDDKLHLVYEHETHRGVGYNLTLCGRIVKGPLVNGGTVDCKKCVLERLKVSRKRLADTSGKIMDAEESVKVSNIRIIDTRQHRKPNHYLRSH